MTQIQRKTHTIDAAGQAAGRIASGIARLLIGKHKPTYVPHLDEGDFVRVINASQIKFTGKKIEQKSYRGFSGYPGGLKTVAVKKVFAKDPGEVLRRAVKKMMPDNKLRPARMKRLTVIN